MHLLQGGGSGDRQTGYETSEAYLKVAAESLWGNMCLIASVFDAENCCEKSKEATLGDGSVKRLTFSAFLIFARLSHRCRSWTTRVDIAQPRVCAVTFVACWLPMP